MCLNALKIIKQGLVVYFIKKVYYKRKGKETGKPPGLDHLPAPLSLGPARPAQPCTPSVAFLRHCSRDRAPATEQSLPDQLVDMGEGIRIALPPRSSPPAPLPHFPQIRLPFSFLTPPSSLPLGTHLAGRVRHRPPRLVAPTKVPSA